MGTSVNQGSPRTRSWLAAQLTYQDPDFPLERVLQEVWRAATNQPEGDLASQLAQPIIERVRDIAVRGASAVEVSAAVSHELSQSRQTSLAADIARRAAIQCVGTANPTQVYNERLFAEASNYLLSRDLPGFVGIGERTHNVEDSYRFKQSVMRAAVSAVREIQSQSPSAAKDWSGFTSRVVERLKRHTG